MYLSDEFEIFRIKNHELNKLIREQNLTSSTGILYRYVALKEIGILNFT